MADEYECDDLGRCVHHPFVQLKRLSKRTGDWKALLDTCPLCVMDTPSVSGNSVCSSAVSIGRGGSESDEVSTYKKSKVSFHDEGEHERAGALDRSTSSAGSVVSSYSGRSALKAPKYKVCKNLMQRQLDELKGVVKMSEDLDISDDEDSVGEEHHQLVPVPQVEADHSGERYEDKPTEKEQQIAKQIEKEKPQQPQQQQRPPQRQPRPPSQSSRGAPRQQSSRQAGRRSREHSSGRDSPCPPGRHSSGRDSPCPVGRVRRQPQLEASRPVRCQPPPEASRPDPEEFPCNVSVASQSSNVHRSASQRSSRQQHFGSPVLTPHAAHVLRPAPARVAPGPPPRPCYNMVIQAPKDYKDDVSTVTFNTVSVSPPQSALVQCEAVVEEEEWPINTNEYDEKGRCVRHPHIRMRKKKMFGRKWKVLMSACPDCCVDELKRIRAVGAFASNGPQPLSAPQRPSPQEHHPSPVGYRSQGSSRESPNDSHLRSSLGSEPRGRSLSKVPSQNSVSNSSVSSSSRSSTRRGARSPVASLRAKSPVASLRAKSPVSLPRAKSPMSSIRAKSPVSSLRAKSPVSLLRAKSPASLPPPPPRGPVKVSSISDMDTASLTEPSTDSSNEGVIFKPRALVPLPSRGREGGNRVSSSLARHNQVAPYTEPPRDSGKDLFVRQMQHIDEVGGRGLYTGRVDSQFLPDGQGALEYDSGLVQEGRWRGGRFQGRQQRSQDWQTGSSHGRARSESRTRREGGRSRSSSRNRNSTRTRSESRLRVDHAIEDFE